VSEEQLEAELDAATAELAPAVEESEPVAGEPTAEGDAPVEE
jgi:hypothetical protein